MTTNRLTDKEKLMFIEHIVKRAEEWCDDQLVRQSDTILAAFKDIRRIIRDKE